MKTSSSVNDTQKLAITIAYYLAFITLGLTTAVTGPVLHRLAENTGTALGGISYIFIASSLGYMAGTFLSGRAFDRLSGHRLLVIGLVISSIMLAFVPVIAALLVLAFVMVMIGFFQGLLDVGANTLLIWLHGPKVGPYMNGLHFFFGIGAFIAPIIVAQITGWTGDIHWVYWLFAIFNLPVALWVWTLPSPAMPEKTSTAGQPKVHASSLVLGLMMAFFFLYVGLELGYGNWIYSYAVTLGMADDAEAAYLTSVFWGSFTLFRLAGVWISTKTSSQNILFADFAGSALGLGLVLLFPESKAALWIGTLILGAAIASIFPTMLTLAENRLHLTGEVTSWFFIGSGVGGMILPWLIGQIFEPLGAVSMMVFIMVDLVLNVTVLALVLAKSKNE